MFWNFWNIDEKWSNKWFPDRHSQTSQLFWSFWSIDEDWKCLHKQAANSDESHQSRRASTGIRNLTLSDEKGREKRSDRTD
jgi:hypothetical protein